MAKTWGELQKGDKIVAGDGSEWQVWAEPVQHDYLANTVQLGITNGDQWHTVEKPAEVLVPQPEAEFPQPEGWVEPDNGVRRPEESVTLRPDLAAITESILADESAEEEQVRTGPKPHTYPNAAYVGDLKLRSHLYLWHDYLKVGELSDRSEMLQVHENLHTIGLGVGTAHEHEKGDTK